MNPGSSVEVLTATASSKDSDMRYYSGLNPSLPLELIVKLSEDRHWGVRRAIVQNPATPPYLRRPAFFTVLVEWEAAFEEICWDESMDGITRDEWTLAQTLATIYTTSHDFDAIRETARDLEDAVRAVCG